MVIQGVNDCSEVNVYKDGSGNMSLCRFRVYGMDV